MEVVEETVWRLLIFSVQSKSYATHEQYKPTIIAIYVQYAK